MRIKFRRKQIAYSKIHSKQLGGSLREGGNVLQCLSSILKSLVAVQNGGQWKNEYSRSVYGQKRAED